MNKNISHTIRIITFFIIMGIVFYETANKLERKDSKSTYNDFFEAPTNHDVIFLGTSHVQCSIFPTELYKDYGITSYNFGNGSSYMKATYYTFKNLLDYTTPELIVVDTYYMDSDMETFGNISYAHSALDTFPLSKSKVDVANNLFKTTDEKIEILFPFVNYHNRWRELSSVDFSYKTNTLKGASLQGAIAENAIEPQSVKSSIYSSKKTVSKEYLEKLIVLAKSRNIKILLTTIPYPASKDEQMNQNYAFKLAEKYNINYLNLLEVSNLINYKTDMADENSHLNVSYYCI